MHSLLDLMRAFLVLELSVLVGESLGGLYRRGVVFAVVVGASLFEGGHRFQW